MKVKVKNKLKISDKFASVVFEELITILLNKYDNSDASIKEKFTFEEYCRALKEESYNKRKNKVKE